MISLATKAIGTIIGRKTTVGKRHYRQVMVYIPADVSIDSQFFFQIGQPCEIELDVKEKVMTVRPISEQEAEKRGWARRQRSKA